MSMQATINEAAALMAEFDKGAANIYRTRPFNRVGIAKAFRAGFRTHSKRSLKVCDILDRVAEVDVKMRALTC